MRVKFKVDDKVILNDMNMTFVALHKRASDRFLIADPLHFLQYYFYISALLRVREIFIRVSGQY